MSRRNAPRQRQYRGNGKDRNTNASAPHPRNHPRGNNRNGMNGYNEGMEMSNGPRQRHMNRGNGEGGNYRGNHPNNRYNNQGGNQNKYYARNYKQQNEYIEGNRRDGMGRRDNGSQNHGYYGTEN